MTENDQKEQFNIAYVRAVAARAGFAVQQPEIDDDSVDLTIAQAGGNGTLKSPKCDVQLKCTSGHLLAGGGVSFPLPIKNYDDLREETLVPRILVVMLVPDSLNDWLTQTVEEMTLRRCCYWISLLGSSATANSATVSVTMPVEQVFTVEALDGIMGRIGHGGKP